MGFVSFLWCPKPIGVCVMWCVHVCTVVKGLIVPKSKEVASMYEFLDGCRLVLKERFGFEGIKNTVQAEMLQKVYCMVPGVASRLLMVLPTNVGKSLCYRLVPFVERLKGYKTVVIVPLKGLLTDQIEYCKEKKIPFHLFVPTYKGSLVGTELENLPGLIFVQLEHVSHRSFMMMLMLLGDRLRRIIVDEIHVILNHASFRPSCYALPGVSAITQCPMIGLSGSLPPTRVSGLCEVLCWKQENVDMLRHSCNRVNIQMMVKTFDNRLDMFHCLQDVARDIMKTVCADKGQKSWTIVYCMTHARVDAVLDELGRVFGRRVTGGNQESVEDDCCRLFSCHSGMSPLKQRNNLCGWREQQNSVMVTCPGLCAGIHHDNVRDVIFVDGFYSLEDLSRGWVGPGEAGVLGFVGL